VDFVTIHQSDLLSSAGQSAAANVGVLWQTLIRCQALRAGSICLHTRSLIPRSHGIRPRRSDGTPRGVLIFDMPPLSRYNRCIPCVGAVMDFLEELNPRQREAVQAECGPVLVLAGPGSGKTRVLIYRVAYLVRACDVAPWHLMAVTFTNKAAREMRERLASGGNAGARRAQLLTDRQLDGLTVGTFHATCARILRRESESLAGWDSNFVIYDTDDQLALVRQAVRELNMDEKKSKPSAILNAISKCKNDLISPDRFRAGSYFDEIVRRVYPHYQRLLQQNNAFDFDDLIMMTVELLRQRSDLLTAYRQRFRHVLVDEFQDTNLAQYELVKLLAGPQPCLFAVADEDQSIYSWRGADYRNVLRFRDDFPKHRLILLEQNYRSTATILEAAKHVIRRNVDRVDKDLFTQRGAGARIRVVEAYDEHAEAQFVVDEIARLQANGDHPAGHSAIMYRTNAQSRVLEEEFITRGMPYRLVRGTRFYERKEIRDALAYLRLVHNPRDAVSMARIINTPARGIGAQTVADLERWAFGLGISAFDALLKLRDETAGERLPLPSPFNARGRNALLKFTELLTYLLAARERSSLPELFDTALVRSGYRDFVRDGTPEGQERWDNLLELRGVTQEFAAMDPHEALSAFLEQVALVSDADGLSDGEGAPALLTLHAAKGLEFPVVFIVGMDEDILPHSRSKENREAMEEERRLCYVGITRARDRLYLVHTFRRTALGQGGMSVPSRFLKDIPDELIEGRMRPTRKRVVNQPERSQASGGDMRTAWHTPARAPATGRRPGPARFKAGDTVMHAKFGEGIVIASHLTGDDEEIEVAFPKQGVKRLSTNLAPLQKLERP
jgi:DNA helicase-2/ATP-dependent DNA helicase PcrA